MDGIHVTHIYGEICFVGRKLEKKFDTLLRNLESLQLLYMTRLSNRRHTYEYYYAPRNGLLIDAN